MRMFRFNELPKAIVLAWTILLFAGLANAQPSARLDDDDDKKSPTPPGLYISPMTLPHKLSELRRRRGGKGRGQSGWQYPGDLDSRNELAVRLYRKRSRQNGFN